MSNQSGCQCGCVEAVVLASDERQAAESCLCSSSCQCGEACACTAEARCSDACDCA